jgi:AraC-like DNA-binding protein
MSMSELADMCCLSVSTFKRRFKEHIGGTPREWIVAKRMELAHEMLNNSDITISALAKLCCFSNTSHFIEVFKSHYHTTPYAYRDRLTQRPRE